MADHGERGASAVEYGLMLAAVATLIIAATFALGGVVSSVFSMNNSCIAAGAPSQC